MYSSKIKNKVDVMFDNLRKKTPHIIADSSDSNEAINKIVELVSSELTTRSKTILSDMLFDLSDSLMETDFFADIVRQNRFYEINLRQEILSKYQFAVSDSMNYKEASKEIQAFKVGAITLVGGGVVDVGMVLISCLSKSSLAPIPIWALIAASIGVALTDYLVIEPKKNKKALADAVDSYLVQTKQQFMDWFDEVECFFNKRVEEIKHTM